MEESRLLARSRAGRGQPRRGPKEERQGISKSLPTCWIDVARLELGFPVGWCERACTLRRPRHALWIADSTTGLTIKKLAARSSVCISAIDVYAKYKDTVRT
jgi:hypothetical protein